MLSSYGRRWSNVGLMLEQCRQAKQIILVLVSSKLDYRNSLSQNMPEKDIPKLQPFRTALQ